MRRSARRACRARPRGWRRRRSCRRAGRGPDPRRRNWRSPPWRRAARSAASGGTARTAPSPPKTKGKETRAERIAHRADDRGAGHVDGLVAAGLQRVGRFHDVGGADLPVVGERRVDRRIADLLEGVEDRQLLVAEGGRSQRSGRLRGRLSSREAEELLRLADALQRMLAHRAPELRLDRRDLRGWPARARRSSWSASRCARPR